MKQVNLLIALAAMVMVGCSGTSAQESAAMDASPDAASAPATNPNPRTGTARAFAPRTSAAQSIRMGSAPAAAPAASK